MFDRVQNNICMEDTPPPPKKKKTKKNKKNSCENRIIVQSITEDP